MLARCACPLRVLRRITFITEELDFSWNPGFQWSGFDFFAACAFLDPPSTSIDPSRRPFPPPPLWFGHDARPTVSQGHDARPTISQLSPWPDRDALCGEPTLDRVEFFAPPGEMMRASRIESIP